MDLATGTSAISAIAAILSALYARHSLSRSREALMFQALSHIASDYRSPEMFLAVKSLWRFKRENPDDLVGAYNKRRLEDAAHLDTLPPTARLEYEKTTIHFQRRLVSRFYSVLASLHEKNLPEPGLIYSLWSADDLKIIPEMIIPLERAVSAGVKADLPSHHWIDCKGCSMITPRRN
jgi:hypothetical protein